jgi:hypothetical protein
VHKKRGIHMKFAMCALGFALLGSSSVGAATLPTSGACEWESQNLFLDVRIVWSAGKVEISASGKKYTSEIVGMREHGGQFKFSTFYIDDIMGLTELVLFANPISENLEYRMGQVTYDELSGGERVVASMSGFSDATCVVMP